MQFNNLKQKFIEHKLFVTVLTLLLTLILSITIYFVFVDLKSKQSTNCTDSNCTNNESNKTVKYSNKVCWNKVINQDSKYYWPNTCKGDPNPDICALKIVPLNSEEIESYQAWISEGSKLENLDPNCNK